MSLLYSLSTFVFIVFLLFIAIPNDRSFFTRFDTNFKQTEVVVVLSYWSPLHALWRPPEHNVCSGRNNSTRSERTQTRLSRRLRKHWYRTVIYRGRRVGEWERGMRKPNEETYYNGDEGASEGWSGVVRTSKEEWMGALCARWLGGVAASRRRTAYVDSIPLLFHNNREILGCIIREAPLPITVMRLTPDNSWRFMDSASLSPRDFFFIEVWRESERAWAPFIPRRCRKSRSYGDVLTANNEIKEGTDKTMNKTMKLTLLEHLNVYKQ